MDGGVGEAALIEAMLAGSEGAAAASVPLTAAEIGTGAAAGGAGLGAADAGLLGAGAGGLAEGLGAGAAGELGATSSGIGAAGLAANPFSLAFTNAVSGLGSPGASDFAYKLANMGPAQIKQGLSAMNQAQQVSKALGFSQPPPRPAAAARPNFGQAAGPVSASQVFGRQGLMGQAGPQIGGGGLPSLSPQMLMLMLQRMQQAKGGM